MIELLRISRPADHPPLFEAYERLLREHLQHWPSQASADKVRLWLARLLVARRDWPKAIEALQHVRETSDSFGESVRLVTLCYEKQLQQLDPRHEQAAQQRAKLLSAATSEMQPIITGTDNRWPDRWATTQGETAVALARMHLRYSAAESTYAERLLAAALRGPTNGPESAADQKWQAAARCC